MEFKRLQLYRAQVKNWLDFEIHGEILNGQETGQIKVQIGLQK